MYVVLLQGFILGPLLFNIDKSGMFLIAEKYEITIYSDEKTSYSGCQVAESIMLTLRNYRKFLLSSFFLTTWQVILINATSCTQLVKSYYQCSRFQDKKKQKRKASGYYNRY